MRTRTIASLGILALALLATAEVPETSRATVAYLQKLQTAEGGFVAEAGKTKPSLRATSSALRALKYFGGGVPNRPAVVRFVESCCDKASGGFADTPGGKPDVATTAVGAMALVELSVPTDPYEAGILRYLGANTKTYEEIRIAAAGVEALGKQPPEAKDWLKVIDAMRKPDGTFGAARETGGATVALLRLGGDIDETGLKKILVALANEQNADGGYGKSADSKSDLETTYRVMRCFHRVNVVYDPRRKVKLLAFIERCRNADGGYGVAPGQPSSVSGTYYAGIIRHWQSEK